MSSRSLLSACALVVAVGAGGCAADSQQPADAENSVGKTEAAQLIAATGNIMAWPLAGITWNGLVGTWPIAVWSPATIGGLAFDVTGVTGLGVTLAGFPGITAVPISNAFLTAFTTPAAAPFLGTAPLLGAGGLFAPAFGFTGAFNPWIGAGVGFGAFAPSGLWTGTFANGLLTPGWLGWTPTLTTSALMFNNLTAINAMTSFTFNVTFTAQAAAQIAAMSTAALSIFATPILSSALVAGTAIPFTSLAFPIMLPFATTGLLASPGLATGLL